MMPPELTSAEKCASKATPNKIDASGQRYLYYYYSTSYSSSTVTIPVIFNEKLFFYSYSILRTGLKSAWFEFSM